VGSREGERGLSPSLFFTFAASLLLKIKHILWHKACRLTDYFGSLKNEPRAKFQN
jgi:hypothetical protein